jgi:tetratricopeptide (TPR) repeat protein
VLKHHLDQAGAVEEYRKAIAEYEDLDRGKSERASLRALCLVDFGRFLAQKRSYPEAIEQYRTAEQLIGKQPTVLYVASLCGRAEAHRRLCQWSEAQASMAAAVKLAIERLPANHPLLAYTHQQAAWGAFERWQLLDAMQSFELANRVFGETSETSDHATITRIHGLHGRAMTERYAGYLSEARERFEHIDAEIEKILEDPRGDGLSPMLEKTLCDRRVNTKERLADSYLFCGQPAEAKEHFARAIEMAKDLPADRREAILFQLHAKKAIALALTDDPKAAGDALKAAGSQRLMVKQFRDMSLVLKLAEALTEKAWGDDGTALRDFVNEGMRANLEEMRRDDLEMILLANATLNDDASADNVRPLLKVILKTRDPLVRAFARRYQDAVIRHLAERGSADDQEALLSWVLYTKTGREGMSLSALRKSPSLLLHADDSFGLAVLFKPGAVPVVSTFKQGHAAWRAKGQAPQPPWDKALADAMAAIDGPITVYWSDPVCTKDAPYPFAFSPADRCMPGSFDSPAGNKK